MHSAFIARSAGVRRAIGANTELSVGSHVNRYSGGDRCLATVPIVRRAFTAIWRYG